MSKSIDEIIKKKSPIIFLFGQEEFLIGEALEKLINSYFPNKKNTYDFDLLDGGEIDERTIVERCSSFPMMSEKRLVVVKNTEKLFTGRSKKADRNSSLAKYLSSPSVFSTLVFVAFIDTFSGIGAGLAGKNKAKFEKMIEQAKYPYNILLKNYDWIEFPKLYDNQIITWIRERFKIYGKQISQEAANLLFALTSGELRDIANEVEKICLFVGDSKEITLDDISKVTGNRRTNNVFELQKAIGVKNIALANEILFNMLATERQEMLIITMLTRYFIAIWKVQELLQKTKDSKEIADAIGVNSYFIKDYIEPAKIYSNKATENAIISLCEADFELKSSGGNNILTLQNLIEKIINYN